MNASTPALSAMWPTRLRNARAVPQLNQLPCRWRIAAPFRARGRFGPPPGYAADRICLKGDAVGRCHVLHDAVERNSGSDSSEFAFHGCYCRPEGSHCGRIFRAEGMNHGQDCLVDVFSRISACIDFSFDFWRFKELSVGVRALSTKPPHKVELEPG